jgi:hypothetical protein
VQPTEYACGAVAALAAARLSEADWRKADVPLTVHPNIISNAAVSWLNLGLCTGDECPPLSSTQVADLYDFFIVVRTPSRVWHGWNGALFSVLPFDIRQAVEASLVEEDVEESCPMELVCVCVQYSRVWALACQAGTGLQ